MLVRDVMVGSIELRAQIGFYRFAATHSRGVLILVRLNKRVFRVILSFNPENGP